MKTMHGNITTSTFTKNYVTATTFVVIIILTLPAVLAMVVNPVIEKTAVTTKSLTPPNYKLYDESSDSDAFTLLVRTATDALLERENGRRGNGDGGGTTSSVGTDLIDGVYAEALRDILDRTSIRVRIIKRVWYCYLFRWWRFIFGFLGIAMSFVVYSN